MRLLLRSPVPVRTGVPLPKRVRLLRAPKSRPGAVMPGRGVRQLSTDPKRRRPMCDESSNPTCTPPLAWRRFRPGPSVCPCGPGCPCGVRCRCPDGCVTTPSETAEGAQWA